jgi:hypothetical protein
MLKVFVDHVVPRTLATIVRRSRSKDLTEAWRLGLDFLRHAVFDFTSVWAEG